MHNPALYPRMPGIDTVPNMLRFDYAGVLREDIETTQGSQSKVAILQLNVFLAMWSICVTIDSM